jgi:hypothetical protein
MAKKQAKSKVAPPEPEPKIERNPTFTLKLTRFEVLHLRDLFSVALPPEAQQTVSQALAALEERELIEAKLWGKLVLLCQEAKLPLDNGAPDFVCAAASAPPVGVFRLAHDPQQAEEPQGDNAFEHAQGDK